MTVAICREFFASNAVIKLFCVFIAYLAIHYVYRCQVIGELGVCSLFLLFDILLCKIIILYIILGTYTDVVLCLNPWATITLNF